VNVEAQFYLYTVVINGYLLVKYLTVSAYLTACYNLVALDKGGKGELSRHNLCEITLRVITVEKREDHLAPHVYTTRTH
jgi:hypothetical protein